MFVLILSTSFLNLHMLQNCFQSKHAGEVKTLGRSPWLEDILTIFNFFFPSLLLQDKLGQSM